MKRQMNREDYSVFLKQIEEEKKETSSLTKTLLVLVLVLCVLVVGFILSIKDMKTAESLFGKDTFMTKVIECILTKRANKKVGLSMPFFSRRQNVLLLGVDSNGSNTDPWRGTRSDTIILMSIDAKDRSVKAISIPRDSKVYLPDNNGIQKINAAHAIGGVEMTKRTIEDTLGVKIDKYIIISDDAVENVVNTLDGVPVYVEKKMSYDDFSGNLHIHLNKGLNVLKGREAVGYLRFRHDGLGDIGRTQRQQWFLRSLLEKLQSPQAIVKLPEIVNVANKYIKTDLSLYDMSQYAALVKSIDFEKVEVATLPGRPNKKGSISYWILDPEKTQQTVNRIIYRDEPVKTDKKFVAGIMYSPEKEQEAMAVKSQFEELGFEVNCMGRNHLPHSQFVANSTSVTNDFYNWLKKKVPNIDDNQFVYDPNKYYCSNSDFVVIISGK